MTQTIRVPSKDKTGNDNRLLHTYPYKTNKEGYYVSLCGHRKRKDIGNKPDGFLPKCLVCEDLKSAYFRGVFKLDLG